MANESGNPIVPKTYRFGTSAYTKFGLAALFAWLLLGRLA